MYLNYIFDRICVTTRFVGFSVYIYLTVLYGKFTANNIIQNANIYLNGSLLCKGTDTTLYFEDIIEFCLHKKNSNFIPVFDFLDIIHEETSYVTLNKNSSTITHSLCECTKYTLSNKLLYFYPQLYCVPRCGIVHRLDKFTVGIIIVVCSLFMYYNFLENLRNSSVTRVYETIVHGVLYLDGCINVPIKTCSNVTQRVISNVFGKYSITFYCVIKQLIDYTYVAVYLGTGRKHQIRAHFSCIKHPIVGDILYGGAAICCDMYKPVLYARQIIFKNCRNRSVFIFLQVCHSVRVYLSR
jgi:RluA family pseudouridine synthase